MSLEVVILPYYTIKRGEQTDLSMHKRPHNKFGGISAAL